MEDLANCLICGQTKRYATRHYTHVYDQRMLYPGAGQAVGVCKPPAPSGEHICWYCSKHEKEIVKDTFVTHDLSGDRIHSCLPPAPPEKYRCNNCHGVTDYYDQHYHDFDQGGEYRCTKRK